MQQIFRNHHVDFGLADQDVFAGLEGLAELRNRTSHWTRR